MENHIIINFLFKVKTIRVAKRINNSLNDNYGLNHMSTIFILWKMSPSKHPILLSKKHGR